MKRLDMLCTEGNNRGTITVPVTSTDNDNGIQSAECPEGLWSEDQDEKGIRSLTEIEGIRSFNRNGQGIWSADDENGIRSVSNEFTPYTFPMSDQLIFDMALPEIGLISIEKSDSIVNKSLIGNEKRKETCKINYEPVVAETKRKIKEAVAGITDIGGKLTQRQVASLSGLSLPTIKKYRKYYKELLITYKSDYNTLNTSEIEPVPIKEDVCCQFIQPVPIPASELDIECFDKDIDKPINELGIEDDDIIKATSNISIVSNTTEVIADNQRHSVFSRIFEYSLKKLNEDQVLELFNRFYNQFNSLPESDAMLFIKPIEEINDSDTYFRQGSLERSFLNLKQDLLDKIQNNDLQRD